MPLTRDNIIFIDNYFKNSGIVYFDIRMEIIDHVANAVEQKMEAENLDFYNAFKNYMIRNKKDLLNDNKKEGFYFDVLPKFGKFLIQPFQILVFIASFIIYYILFQKYDSEKIVLNSVFPLFIIILKLILYQWLYLGLYKKKRFYAIEKTGGIVFLIYQAAYFSQSFFRNFTNKSPYVELFMISLFMGLFINYFIFHFTEMHNFKKKNLALFQ